MVLRLMENVFGSQKIESIHFYSWPPGKTPLGSYYQPPCREKFLIPSKKTFLPRSAETSKYQYILLLSKTAMYKMLLKHSNQDDIH